MKWINKYFSRTEFLLADCVKSKLHHMIKFSTLIKIMNQVKVFSRKTNGCTNLSLIKLRTDQTQSLNFLLKGKWHDSVNIEACGWNFRSHLSAIFWCMSKSLVYYLHPGLEKSTLDVRFGMKYGASQVNFSKECASLLAFSRFVAIKSIN